ncbi:MAG: acyl-CoA dehydrogenase family protein [Nevskia sp.]|nr:acyl-CoA dehydrogenase family protein [Nevskia sp.]
MCADAAGDGLRVNLPLRGLEVASSSVQTMLADAAHQFALAEMRPAGAALDRLPADAVIAAGSLFWVVQRKFAGFGISPTTLRNLPAEEGAELQSILFEELGWGDAGLAISLGAGMLPTTVALLLGRPEFARRWEGKGLGAWGITEPDHGTDMLDPTHQISDSGHARGRPNCVATVTDGQLCINGQKSAWVSNGPVATHCILFCAYGNGPGSGNCVVYVPLDAPGISRGAPLDKLGQRALPQGEIFFDNVRIPLDCLACPPEEYSRAVYLTLTHANAGMGAVFVGVARAAYEHALAYAHERKQDGVPIIGHQNVRYRLFHMFRKIECARALNRRVMRYNAVNEQQPALQGSIASKITSTQTAFEVASDALQIFGGAGLAREYPMEKLLRDARASLIEDGCNEVLAIKGGSYLFDPARLGK